jgi:hypothetical protein
MSKPRKKKRTPKRVLALPDLEQSKTAALNTVTSKSGQRSYDRAITDFVDWYCSEPRLAFNRTVVLRYRIFLEQKQYAATTINLRLAAVRVSRLKLPIPAFSVRNSLPDPTSQGCPPNRSSRWKLADSGSGQAVAFSR